MDSEKKNFLESLSEDEKHNIFFDRDLTEISIEDILLKDILSDVTYIFIKNEKMIDIVQKVCDFEYFYSPWNNKGRNCQKRIGFYEWDYNYDAWFSLVYWPEVEQELYRLTGVDA